MQAFLAKLRLDRHKANVKITVTSDDGSVRELRIDKSPLNEEQVKQVVDLLTKAADAGKADSKN